MRRFLACLLVVAASLAAVPVQAQIPAEILKEIKAATVFVKVRTSLGEGSGSGFLMQVDGDNGLIVTNEHVISGRSSKSSPAGRPLNVDVVLDSGRATERVIPATVLAADAEPDLAILQVKNVTGLPKPLNIPQKLDVVETMTVYVAGFPFGTMLSTTKGNPAITIGKGTISSIREDERGEVKYVQIDGDINPGNSGGPVVDAKGRLVGVAVAKLAATNIGLAIPPTELTKMLNGRHQQVTMRLGKVEETSAEVLVELQLIDPMHKIGKVSIRVLPADDLPAASSKDKDGKFLPLPKSQIIDLKIEDQKAVGSFKAFKSGDNNSRSYVVQPVYVRGDKVLVHAAPENPYSVRFSTPPAVKATPTPKPSSSEPSVATSPVPVQQPVTRKWTDASGAFTMEGSFLETKNGKVYFRGTNGKKYSILLEQLSETDKQFVASRTN